MAGQQVDRLAEARDADIGIGDFDLGQLVPGHLQGITVHAGNAQQARIVEQHRLPVDRELHVEAQMPCTQLQRRA